jgi:hypothetical protein
MCGANDREVPPIERGDAMNAEALGDGQGGVIVEIGGLTGGFEGGHGPCGALWVSKP